MKKNSHKRWSFFLCLLMVLSLTAVGCEKKCSDDEIFVPDQEQTEGEGDAADTQDTANAEEPAAEPETQTPDSVPEASGYTAPEADTNVSYVVLGVGSDQSQVVLTRYGLSGNEGRAVVAKASEMSGNTFPVTALLADSTIYSANYNGYNVNTATVTGLEPDTTYQYMVGNEEGWSAMHSFHTAKSGETNILVTGDIQLGTGDDDAASIENWKRISRETKEKFPEYNLHLNMGDVTTMPFEDHYINVLTSPMFTDYPTAVVLGNHDYANLYQMHFSRPNQSDFGARNELQNGNFWFRYGDTLFMELNYMIETDDILIEHGYFIKQAIEANPDCKWKVVMMHYSPYSSVEKYQKYANENREYWLKVFDENDIDVVLNGHDHAYTRTYIIKNGQPQVTDATSVTNPDGTLYLTFGSASGSQYHDVSPLSVAAKCIQNNHPQMSTLNITDSSFKMTLYDADTWEVLDQFEIVKN